MPEARTLGLEALNKFFKTPHDVSDEVETGGGAGRVVYAMAGQQQLRYYWANVAAWHLTMWLHTHIELWAWHKAHPELVNRKASPWDHADRRPSHADRLNALRRICLESEFKRDPAVAGFNAKTRRLWTRLLSLVA